MNTDIQADLAQTKSAMAAVQQIMIVRRNMAEHDDTITVAQKEQITVLCDRVVTNLGAIVDAIERAYRAKNMFKLPSLMQQIKALQTDVEVDMAALEELP